MSLLQEICVWLINCMEQSQFWEANRSLARWEIYQIFWNAKDHYGVYRRLLLVPIQSQMRPVPTLLSVPTPPSGLFLHVLQPKPYVFISLLSYACHVPHPPYSPWSNNHHNTFKVVQIIKILIMQFCPTYCFFPPL